MVVVGSIEEQIFHISFISTFIFVATNDDKQEMFDSFLRRKICILYISL